jgi:hypothetical protein
MKKLFTFLLLIVISCLLGGLYGVLHDQLTYSISPEYYTKFKFYQFGFTVEGEEKIFANPRFYVSIVGFLATWWMGLFIGSFLALVGFIHSEWKLMFSITLKAFLLTMLIAFLTGLIGLAYGHFFLADLPKEEFSNWYLPENLIDFRNFIKVGSMHNFSYMGGVIGLVIGMVYSISQKPALASAIFWWTKK